MTITLLIISVLLIVLGLVFKHNCSEHPRKKRMLDGKKPNLLGSINSFGFTMLGNFTYNDGVQISYYCLSVCWCPIIPLGCYACQVVSSEGNSTTYVFGGSQPWKAEEILSLYSRWLWIVALVCAIILMGG